MLPIVKQLRLIYRYGNFRASSIEFGIVYLTCLPVVPIYPNVKLASIILSACL